jgi:hypothetical protein
MNLLPGDKGPPAAYTARRITSDRKCYLFPSSHDQMMCSSGPMQFTFCHL